MQGKSESQKVPESLWLSMVLSIIGAMITFGLWAVVTYFTPSLFFLWLPVIIGMFAGCGARLGYMGHKQSNLKVATIATIVALTAITMGDFIETGITSGTFHYSIIEYFQIMNYKLEDSFMRLFVYLAGVFIAFYAGNLTLKDL